MKRKSDTKSFLIVSLLARVESLHAHIFFLKTKNNQENYGTYLGGMDPSTFLSVYLLDLMSSMRISYGVSSYSIGVLEKLTFFNFTPIRSSPMTCIQNRACKILRAMSQGNIIAMLKPLGVLKLVTDVPSHEGG